MEQLIAVFFIEVFFCCISYVLSNGVFANPTFMSYIVLMASTLFAIVGNSSWNVKISDLLIIVALLGMSSMLFAQLLAKRIGKRYRYKEKNGIKKIIINKQRTRFIILAVILLTLMYCIDIIRAGSSMGYSGLTAIYAVKKDKSGTSIIIRQGVKFVMAFAYLHMFIFVNNFVIKRKHSFDEAINIIPALCGVICSVFTSVRTDILRLITAFMVDFCVLYFQSRDWERKSLGRVIKKITPIIIIGAFFMTGLKTIVKGTNNATSMSYGLIEYLCYYIGSPIIVLGSKLYTGISSFSGNVWGENTFNQALLFMKKLGLLGNVVLRDGSANVWIEESKKITANVDTIFGSPTIDFGIIGMAIYIFIIYYIFNSYYEKKIAKTYSGRERDCNLIVFSYVATLSSMAYYTNYFNRFLTIYFILTLVLIKVFWKIYKVNYSEV